ncbi:hypothetical protein [Roseibium algae]|uniref:Uncharacterized protein n=1 Tax=Roseibium algae TaxID=3123038 RepID=A0ABU8TIL9_9HYPH
MALVDILKERSVWTYSMMVGSTQLGEMIGEEALTTVNVVQIQCAMDSELAKIRRPTKSARQSLTLSTTRLSGSGREKQFGGDWLWNYKGKTYVIQAKRLDVIKDTNLATYQIDIPQLRRLLETAAILQSESLVADASAYYVFYNTMIGDQPLPDPVAEAALPSEDGAKQASRKGDRSENAVGRQKDRHANRQGNCRRTEEDTPEERDPRAPCNFGCTMLSAQVLFDEIEKQGKLDQTTVLIGLGTVESLGVQSWVDCIQKHGSCCDNAVVD